MSERNYRLRTNISTDSVVKVHASQDIDFLEILSLKLSQEDLYRLHTSNYGVLVGRVLANDAFGIPNAKVSVFLPLDDEDKLLGEITSLYPYATITTKGNDHKRYNLLPNDATDDCYRVVGSFPVKRMVLDNDTEIEIYDKYWKYTTVTNSSGDYMIYGVPVGNQSLHVDIDLSDIGILSQKPRDFFYKGYPITQFDNATQFKESTNLDNLSQIIAQDSSVYIYPFWGDTNLEEIAISRHDVQVQYKFEPTCVFMGSVVTDNFANSINHKCSPSKKVGYNRNLVAPNGTIEMIRKTPDGLVEEFQIQGNQLIDGDGVFCYQIPMNLNYVGTDEYGNIVPTDDPNKGIATKTSVRFRFSIQETGDEGISRHRAKFLVPNNPPIADKEGLWLEKDVANNFDQYFAFGSATPDDAFRDLYWNKVYSIKSYIPRLQTTSNRNTQNYVALRSNNFNEGANPIPFNNIRIRLSFNYKIICLLTTIVANIIAAINRYIICFLDSICLPFGLGCLFKIGCIGFNMVGGDDEESDIAYNPGCKSRQCRKVTKCPDEIPNCTINYDLGDLMDKVQQSLAIEYETTNLDLSNDWINGCLYFPLWFWRKTKKKKYLFGLFSRKAVNQFCSCSKSFKKLRLAEPCAMPYPMATQYEKDGQKDYHRRFRYNKIKFGFVREVQNNAGLNIYYYTPGLPKISNYGESTDDVEYIRLFSTDIILLGTLNDCDIDNVPQLFTKLPTTTSNVPFITAVIEVLNDNSIEDIGNDGDVTENEDQNELESNGTVETSGMDWLHTGKDDNPTYKKGLFYDLACLHADTAVKTCINAFRMSELGVSLDGHIVDTVSARGKLATSVIKADGMITRYEIIDNEGRAMFASMNHNGLTHKVKNINTGYDMYRLSYLYPVDFDGRMESEAAKYTKKTDVKTYDYKDQAYIDFRYGINEDNSQMHFYDYNNSAKGKRFPVYNNSFFFYFGLNEGSTALDKFYTNFYSTCYNSKKYPFTLTINTTSAQWCHESDDTDGYATATVKMDGIKYPYSYALIDDFGNEIISEKGMVNDTLRLGYKVIENGGGYEEKDGEYVKYGIFQYYLTGEDVPSKYAFENGSYTIRITDANNNTVVEQFTIEQINIDANYQTVDLGAKYYPNATTARDICNDSSLYGEITISSLMVDGKDFAITNYTEQLQDSIYELTLSDGSKVQLKIDSLVYPDGDIEEDSEPYSMSECGCNGINNYQTFSPYQNADGTWTISFKVWRPGNYQFSINQICNNALNDNSATYIVEIKNGQSFNAYINTMPLKFMVGDTTKPMTSGYFYQNNANSPANLLGWFNVDNEDFYQFSAITSDNISIWNDFVTISTEDGKIDEGSMLNTILYKFTSMFELAKGVYITDDGNPKTLAMTTTGGKLPTAYRGSYPLYENFKNDNGDYDSVTNDWLTDNEGYVSCDLNTANIVPYSYVYYDDKDRQVMLKTTVGSNKKVTYNSGGTATFNPIYNKSSYLGNYFAAFTRNGGVVDSKVDLNIIYQSIPYSATCINTEDILSKHEAILPIGDMINNKDYKHIFYQSSKNPYFRGEFVDRRLGYSFIMFLPYAGDEVFEITNKNNNVPYKVGGIDTNVSVNQLWKYGRLYGSVYNGIEMNYQPNTYNVIGNGLEYFYKTFNGKTETDILPDKKRFYSSFIKYDNIRTNIVDLYQTIGREKVIENYNENSRGIYSIPHIKNKSVVNVDNAYIMPNGNFGGKTKDTLVYPSVRMLDLTCLPACSTFNYDVTSCSYQITPSIDSVTNAITGATEKGENVSFTLSCQNALSNNDLLSIEESAKQGKANVAFEDGGKRSTGVKQSTFYARDLLMHVSLKSDNKNTTHKSFTKHPYLIDILDMSTKENRWANALNHEKVEDVIKDIQTIAKMQFTYEKDSVNGIKEADGVAATGVFNSPIYSMPSNNKWWVSDNGNYVYDDSQEAKNVVYMLSKRNKSYTDPKSQWGVLGVLFERNYLNAENDNMLKEIKTYQMSAIYDVRPIKIDYEKMFIETNELDSASSGEETSTVQTKNCVMILSFQVDKNLDYNQQVASSWQQISAAFKYDKKVTSSVQFVTDLKYTYTDEYGQTQTLRYDGYENGELKRVYILIQWTGELNNVTPSRSVKDCELFMSMPNKLIYQIKFRIKQNNNLFF